MNKWVAKISLCLSVDWLNRKWDTNWYGYFSISFEIDFTCTVRTSNFKFSIVPEVHIRWNRLKLDLQGIFDAKLIWSCHFIRFARPDKLVTILWVPSLWACFIILLNQNFFRSYQNSFLPTGRKLSLVAMFIKSMLRCLSIEKLIKHIFNFHLFPYNFSLSLFW